jgi:hypothetical protein
MPGLSSDSLSLRAELSAIFGFVLIIGLPYQVADACCADTSPADWHAQWFKHDIHATILLHSVQKHLRIPDVDRTPECRLGSPYMATQLPHLWLIDESDPEGRQGTQHAPGAPICPSHLQELLEAHVREDGGQVVGPV